MENRVSLIWTFNENIRQSIGTIWAVRKLTSSPRSDFAAFFRFVDPTKRGRWETADAFIVAGTFFISSTDGIHR